MTLTPITDPWFYFAAVPAVLLLGISKSGFGAGFGSLAVPMMALAISVPQAAAICMPLLLVMDLLGMAAFRKDVDWRLLRFLLPPALIGIVIGALSITRWKEIEAMASARWAFSRSSWRSGPA